MTDPGSREFRIRRADLVGLLAASLGEDKAREVVMSAARELGLVKVDLDRDETLGLLEAIAQNPGLIGIAARFVKSRVHLKWGSDELLQVAPRSG